MSRHIKSVFCLFTAACLVLNGSVAVAAVKEYTPQEKRGPLQIVFTDPDCGESATTDSSADSGGATAPADSGSTELGKLPGKSQKVFNSAKGNIEKQKELYEYGAKKTGLKWEYLAALHYREANNAPGTSIFDGLPLGAANQDGVADTGGTDAKQNAVKAAQHFIGNAKMVYGVDIKKDTSFSALQKAFLAYNRGFIYKWGHVSADKSAYVMSGYDAEHALPMKWAILPPASKYTEIAGSDARLGAMAILAGLGISASGDSGGGACNSGGSSDSASSSSCEKLGQRSSDKFTFPLCTTQEDMRKGVQYSRTSWVWCYKSTSSCHHDYAAADIHAKEGTMVIAAVGGTVYKVDDPSCSGGFTFPRIQIKAKDNKYYYYAHMKPGSIKIKEGQKIEAGDKIGVVGPGACAQNTGPHLHIHRGDAPTACAGTPGCVQHANYNKNDIQPDLHEVYLRLP